MVDINRWYDQPRDEDRLGDLVDAMDRDPTYVDIYKGRSTTPTFSGIKCLLSLRNNIPNFVQTAGSSGRFNDATIHFLPGVDVDPGDRIVTAGGAAFNVTFINPEQKWGMEVQVTNYARFTVGV